MRAIFILSALSFLLFSTINAVEINQCKTGEIRSQELQQTYFIWQAIVERLEEQMEQADDPSDLEFKILKIEVEMMKLEVMIDQQEELAKKPMREQAIQRIKDIKELVKTYLQDLELVNDWIDISGSTNVVGYSGMTRDELTAALENLKAEAINCRSLIKK